MMLPRTIFGLLNPPTLPLRQTTQVGTQVQCDEVPVPFRMIRCDILADLCDVCDG